MPHWYKGLGSWKLLIVRKGSSVNRDNELKWLSIHSHAKLETCLAKYSRIPQIHRKLARLFNLPARSCSVAAVIPLKPGKKKSRTETWDGGFS